MAREHRREHPVGGVVAGSTVVTSPAAAIEAHGTGRPKRTQTEVIPHPSTSASQRHRGGRSHSTQNVAAAQPVVANPSRGRQAKAPAQSWGSSRKHQFSRHDPHSGNRVLAEGVEGGGRTFMPHHSRTDCGD
jgi:hypothetical protein